MFLLFRADFETFGLKVVVACKGITNMTYACCLAQNEELDFPQFEHPFLLTNQSPGLIQLSNLLDTCSNDHYFSWKWTANFSQCYVFYSTTVIISKMQSISVKASICKQHVATWLIMTLLVIFLQLKQSTYIWLLINSETVLIKLSLNTMKVVETISNIV